MKADHFGQTYELTPRKTRSSRARPGERGEPWTVPNEVDDVTPTGDRLGTESEAGTVWRSYRKEGNIPSWVSFRAAATDVIGGTHRLPHPWEHHVQHTLSPHGGGQ